MRGKLQRMVCAVALVGLVFLLLLKPSRAEDTTNKEGVEGIWLAVVHTGSVELRVVLTVGKKRDGALAGKLDLPDQRQKDLAVDEIALKDGTLRFVSQKLGTFEGKLSEDGKTIEGRLELSGTSFTASFKKTDKVPVVNRPQEPQKPYPYDEEEVAYENKKAGIKLAGTLTLPRSKGPFAAWSPAPGSAPKDREETILGKKPFLVLADYLTRRGIAVLRVDDRGVGQSTGKFAEATTLDFADDAAAGVAYLKS